MGMTILTVTTTSPMEATEGDKDLYLIIVGKHGSKDMSLGLFRLHRSGSWQQGVPVVLWLPSFPLIVWIPDYRVTFSPQLIFPGNTFMATPRSVFAR